MAPLHPFFFFLSETYISLYLQSLLSPAVLELIFSLGCVSPDHTVLNTE